MMKETKGNRRGLFILLCIGVFVVSFIGSIIFKVTYTSPQLKKYSVDWSDDIGTIHTDISYGEKDANKFDIYIPADNSKESYGLVVYLHAGGFTTGDKSDDSEMLQWLCSKGYVAVGINYTLRDDAHPEASVYSQSMEIKEAMPVVIEEAKSWDTTLIKWQFRVALQVDAWLYYMLIEMLRKLPYPLQWYLKLSVHPAFILRTGAAMALIRTLRKQKSCCGIIFSYVRQRNYCRYARNGGI